MSPFRFRRVQLDVSTRYSEAARRAASEVCLDSVETPEHVYSIYRVLAAREKNRGLPELFWRYELKYGCNPPWKASIYYATFHGSLRTESKYVTYLFGRLSELRAVIHGEAVRDVMES